MLVPIITLRYSFITIAGKPSGNPCVTAPVTGAPAVLDQNHSCPADQLESPTWLSLLPAIIAVESEKLPESAWLPKTIPGEKVLSTLELLCIIKPICFGWLTAVSSEIEHIKPLLKLS